MSSGLSAAPPQPTKLRIVPKTPAAAVLSTLVYDSGETWKEIAVLPLDENGKIFAFGGTIYLGKPDGIYGYSSNWSRISQIRSGS